MSESADVSELQSPPVGWIVFRRILLALALLAVVAFGLVFPFPLEGRLSGEVFDLAHAPVFCVALLCLIGFCDPPAIGLSNRFATILPMNLGRVFVITIAVAAVGAIGEYAQKLSGRHPSWSDVFANTIGLFAALAWIGSRAFVGRRKRVLAMAAVGLLIAVSVNPARDAWDAIQQERAFPMLASFERTRELSNWTTHRSRFERSREWASDGDYSAKAYLDPGRYSGITMIWVPYDWTEFRQLRLDLMNPHEQPLTVTIKVFDEYHTKSGYKHQDRFHHDVTIDAGAVNAVELELEEIKQAPAKREMNMRRMWTIQIFSADLEELKVLYVDNLRLAK